MTIAVSVAEAGRDGEVRFVGDRIASGSPEASRLNSGRHGGCAVVEVINPKRSAALHADVGLVDSPRAVAPAQMWPQPLVELQRAKLASA